MGIFFRVCFDLWNGLRFLRNTKKGVSIFGSARLPDSHPYCLLAREIAQELSKKGYSVLTGGGPGIMQAANQGAKEAGGASIGINISLPRESHVNPFVTAAMECRYFFVRKVLLSRYSEAFIILPGGFGTLDEFFEILTLLQTGKMLHRPVVLVGRDYWKGLIDWCQAKMLTEGMINEAEFSRIVVVDSAEEVMLQFLD